MQVDSDLGGVDQFTRQRCQVAPAQQQLPFAAPGLAPQHDDDPSLEVPVTVSIGAMTDAEDLKRPEDLLDRARGALDRARESGGDAIWSSPAPVS